MSSESVFRAWAPENGIWSPWAKPIAFLRIDQAPLSYAFNDVPKVELPPEHQDTKWVPPAGNTAIVVDLPEAISVRAGLMLAGHGYRPVPLYNAAPGWGLQTVPMKMIQIELFRTEREMASFSLPPDAPPAFLLDARRMHAAGLAPGMMDNRWMTFPQDFPSANFLRSKGIESVILWQDFANAPRQDLSHVLLRWQEAGILLQERQLSSSHVERLLVAKPPRYRAWWYLALAALGLARNSAGGFGGIIPQPSSGGGYG